MKDLWRLLLPGMNVPACGVAEDAPAALDNAAVIEPAAPSATPAKPDKTKA